MTVSKAPITLYKQAKAGLKSLFVQTFQVSLGLIAMLVLTGGNPPGWMVSASFLLGIGFVAWSENKGQSELVISIEKYKVASLAKQIKRNSYSQRNLRGANLRNANLSYAYLIRAYLIRAYLIRAYLRDADLRGADLRGVYLRGVYLRDADLRGADLRGANLRGAYLIRADLSGANLRDANLRDANLIFADLSGADLRDANLSRAYLSGADLRDANLFTAIVDSAIFGNNKGIDKYLKNDLIERGAKFIDAPGDTADKTYPQPVRR